MDKLERLYRMHGLFDGRRRAISLAGIAEQLECSPATAKRAIREFRDLFGAPLIYDRDRAGYRYDTACGEPRFELPGLWLARRTRCTRNAPRGPLAPRAGRSRRDPGTARTAPSKCSCPPQTWPRRGRPQGAGPFPARASPRGILCGCGQGRPLSPGAHLPVCSPHGRRGGRPAGCPPAAHPLPGLLVPGCMVPRPESTAQFRAGEDGRCACLAGTGEKCA